MSLFKKIKPFISYRVYMCVDEDDTDSAQQFGFEWDKEYKTWYLDGPKYTESPIAKLDHIKMKFTPFRVHGQHQYFI